MNIREFKKNVSLTSGKVTKKIKHRTKDVVKVCNMGIAPAMAKPNKPMKNVTEKEKLPLTSR